LPQTIFTTLSTAAAVPLDTPREAIAPVWKLSRPQPKSLRGRCARWRVTFARVCSQKNALACRSRTMPQIPPCGPWPFVTQHRNLRVCRSDAERVQMVWRSSSMRYPRDRAGSHMPPVVCLYRGVDLDGPEPPAASFSVLGGHRPRCDPTGLGGRGGPTWLPTARKDPPRRG
jgi:hypothetical protein